MRAPPFGRGAGREEMVVSKPIGRWIAFTATAYLIAGASLFGTQGGKSARMFVPGSFALTIDGANVGILKGMDGGEVSGEVIKENAGPDGIIRKHLGQPRYGDIVMEFGAGLDPKFYDWVAASWSRSYSRKSGAISSLGVDGREVSRLEFSNALVSETVIPECDAASRDAAYLSVRLSPQTTRSGSSGGRSLAGRPPAATVGLKGAPAGGPGQKTSMALLSRSFRLTVAGIDTSRVTRIESFSVKLAGVQDSPGDTRDYLKVPGRVEYPNLTLYVPEAFAKPWQDWFDDFVIRGNNSQDRERAGKLELLSPDLQTVLFTIGLKNLGICKLNPASGEANRDTVRRVKIELYCEEMTFKLGPG